jgi:hypothetical protein
MISRTFSLALFVSLVVPTSASAQTLAADAHLAIARWDVGSGMFNDYGIGGRLTWKPSAVIGLDANLVWYPAGFPPETDVPISAWRVEGLFGATVGPRLGRVRPFAKAGAGFLKIGAASDGVVCVAIFPTPIWCTLGGGTTLPAVEFGGGLEVDAGSSGFLRADIAARLLKYPGPAIDAEFQLRDADYWERGLRLTFGAGLRF